MQSKMQTRIQPDVCVFHIFPGQISSYEMKKNFNTICRDIKHTKSIITRTVLTRCFPPSDYTSRRTGMEC